MRQFIRTLNNTLNDGKELVLATIVYSSGSTPRGAGAMMAVRADGSIEGTVGGGLLEAMTQRAAAKLLETGQGNAAIQRHDLDNELAAKSDMVCGGQITVLLEHLQHNDDTLATVNTLDNALRQGQSMVLLVALSQSSLENNAPTRPVGHALLSEEALPSDFLELPAATLHTLRDQALGSHRPVLQHIDDTVLVAIPFPPQPAVYIFGAGHVSRPTAQMAHIAGFRTVVLDDRDDFATPERFPDADEIIIPASMDCAFDALTVNQDDSLVIVTRGHLHDKTVLALALGTPARYIGMIGSRRKRDAIYTALREEGVDDTAIARCHSPIGLPIGARTPEEIAVSIVAELVQERTAAETRTP